MKNQNSIITLAFLLLISTPIFLMAANQYSTGDTLYVWARTGLNLRDSTTLSASIMETLPYGTMVIVQENKFEYYYKTEENLSIRVIASKTYNNVKHPGFSLQGNWVKVKTGEKEGYLFDGFLSKLEPLDGRIEQIGAKNCFFPSEYILNYFERCYGVLKSFQVQKTVEWKTTGRVIYGNGTIYNSYAYEVAGADEFIIQDIDLEDAYLFFNLFHNLEQSNREESLWGDENFTRLNKKTDDQLEFTVDELGGGLTIRQLENVVIVKLTYPGC